MTGILIVLPRLPHDRSGTGQRSRLLVEAACKVGPTHVVTLDGSRVTRPLDEVLPGVSSLTSLDSDIMMPKRLFAKAFGGGARLISPALGYRVEPALQTSLQQLAAHHGVSTVIFRYARLFCAGGLTRSHGLRVLVDVDDRDDQKYHTALVSIFGARLAGGWIAQRAIGRLSNLLRHRLSDASLIWFAAQEDLWSFDEAETAILPNVPYWSALDVPAPPSSAPPVTLFVGVYGHQPNREGMAWMLREVWPTVVKQRPDARLRIVGKGNWMDMREAHSSLPGVEYIGEVDNVSPEYEAARLCICPVREGGGSKIKVIEAAAFGRPVVASPHALRGFAWPEGLQFLQAADPNDFALECLRLLDDPDLADRTGTALREWQTQAYSREAFVSRVVSALA
ncbi:glycosyltransferase [Roseovarius sp.]|uniref:glycosyltransferase n=1 Tax=Roseovarius sp. TaxID=1486281 RepID=UPI00356B3985